MKKEILYCDECGKKLDNEFPNIITNNISYEVSSYIEFNKKKAGKYKNYRFRINDGQYCDIDCFFRHIKKTLNIK